MTEPTGLQRATWCFNYAGRLSGLYYYVFGGGHAVAPDKTFGGFPATKGDDPEGTNPKGFDCSSWVSTQLWHGGVLGKQFAMDTTELSSWGEAGLGKYLTVWVRDELQAGGVRHALMRYTMPEHPPMWSAGAHTGTLCAWQFYGIWNPAVDNYKPRHFLGG